VPEFLIDGGALQQKFRETKYNQNVSVMNTQMLWQSFSFRSSEVVASTPRAEVSAFREWLEQADLPEFWVALGGTSGSRTTPEALRELRILLAARFEDNVEKFAESTGTPISNWGQIVAPIPDWINARFSPNQGPVQEILEEMLRQADVANWVLSPATGFFLSSMVYPVFGQMDTTSFNQAVGTSLKSFSDFRLPRTVPSAETEPQLRELWQRFVLEELNVSFVVVPEKHTAAWRAFLESRYGSPESYNRAHQSSLRDWSEISLPRRQFLAGLKRDDYRDFLRTLAPEEWAIDAPEFAWRDHLAERYGGIEEINEALGTGYSRLEEIYFPMAALEAAYVEEHPNQLRWMYATRNFRNVFDELFQRGRAFINTVIFCVLAVTSALLINPMAAYAMSRMKLPGTYKVLMVLMATIAFPPMVATIPTFMMLREANLLNTFFALVLPGIANGYLIFMLKGFFDSLPQELYEAATIDGASETRIFFQITMALSKPILAVIALGAFNGAYGTFLYALIVAPDPNMWVLNVWLYQWQQSASTAAVFASVLVASIPTLLVFLVAQNIIMRGIVVPTEK
jgi:multiple sugar transport system permease protein